MGKEYSFLDSGYPCAVRVWIGRRAYTFNNAESAYQAYKVPDISEMFLDLSAEEACNLSLGEDYRNDWEEIKEAVMYSVLRSKFFGNSDLLTELINVPIPIITGKAMEVYWNVRGTNNVTPYQRLLMLIRSECVALQTNTWLYGRSPRNH